MPSKSSTIFSSIRLRKATWLALFALASMQLVLASHQFDHSVGSAAEVCHVCVQADRLDDSIVDDAPILSARNEPHVESALTVATRFDDTAYRLFDSRAPPKL